MKAGPFTLMIAFGIGDELCPVDRSDIEDSQGVPLLSLCSASKWHEDVPRSSSSILLEWDEETCGRLCSTMSHVSIGKG